MKVCIGGTFNLIHKGHKLLIDKAFTIAGKKGLVFIGLSKGKLLDEKKNAKSWNKREGNLKKYIEEKKYKSDFVIKALYDIYGPTTKEDFDVIVVSKETKKNARIINEKRISINKKPMKVVVIPYINAEDGKPISSTRIKEGKIDLNGNLIEGK